MIYLDNSATTRVADEAAAAALAAMQEDFFNPAGAYSAAAETEKKITAARDRVARLVGGTRSEIIYTSGGTESNNTAIFGSLRSVRGKRRVITSTVEHPSVFETVHSLAQNADTEIVTVGVDREGQIRLDELSDALSEDTAFVSLMHVNNETGAVNDIAAFSDLIRKKAPNAIFHADGVQAFGKVPFAKLPCDMYSVSGHKLHAPKGVGFLYVKTGTRFSGGLIGGGQEQNRRSGTTNTPGILGLDAALALYEAHQAEWIQHMRACKLSLAEALLTIEDSVVNGPSPDRGAPHILNVSFPGVRGEVLLHALAQKEIYVSTGSACSSHKRGKNRILNAMNVTGARQDGAIRFSLCPFTTEEEVMLAAEAVREQVAFLRRYQRR